jgi:gluconate 2-dehydrogenase subunit 3-like protein
MESATLSRRSLLQAIAAVIATTTTGIGWTEVAEALDQAHGTHDARSDAPLSFLTSAEAADVEAVAAQIIPTDASPGAREAGVVYFIDRALSTFFSQLSGDYRVALAAFQSAYRTRDSGVASFGDLTTERQIEFLSSIDRTPFFNTTHVLTLLGMFTSPAYGGNRNGTGWKLIGFEDRHAFYPPFGYYDRDYPGFAIETVQTK